MRIVDRGFVFFDTITDAAQRALADEDLADVLSVIPNIHWPTGSGSFTIRPEKHGNGVKPISAAFAQQMDSLDGWEPQQNPFSLRLRGDGPGPFDVGRLRGDREWSSLVEWETGNISSSHRSLNRMCLGMMTGHAFQGILVLPDRDLYNYLTDRIGNWGEVAYYPRVYARTDIQPGRLVAVVVSYDATSESVPKIDKATDGRALR